MEILLPNISTAVPTPGLYGPSADSAGPHTAPQPGFLADFLARPPLATGPAFLISIMASLALWAAIILAGRFVWHLLAHLI